MALTFMSLYSFQCIMLVIVWQKIKLVIPPIFLRLLAIGFTKMLVPNNFSWYSSTTPDKVSSFWT